MIVYYFTILVRCLGWSVCHSELGLIKNFLSNSRFHAQQFTVRLGDIDLRREDEPSMPETYRVEEVRAGYHDKPSLPETYRVEEVRGRFISGC